eukprot:494375_1
MSTVNASNYLSSLNDDQSDTDSNASTATIEDLGDMHIIPNDYLDKVISVAVKNHKYDVSSATQHVVYRLNKHLPEPVSRTLAETCIRSVSDHDQFDLEPKHVAFDLNALKAVGNHTLCTVFGYTRGFESILLSGNTNNSYYYIPELLNLLIVYYYHYMDPKELQPSCAFCSEQSSHTNTSDLVEESSHDAWAIDYTEEPSGFDYFDAN